MVYDVFIASAPADLDLAMMVARRLRALKFKVWANKTRTDDTFDEKDARDALSSRSVLVLWSQNAVASDFVRAAASVAHSKADLFVQARLDGAPVPAPFDQQPRPSLEGLTARKAVVGWYETVDALGERCGRRNLRAWMDLPRNDEDGQSAWLAAHPDDPLAQHAERQRRRKLGVKPAPAPEAAGAAALAASSIKALPKRAYGDGGHPREIGSEAGLVALVAIGLGLFTMLVMAYQHRIPPPMMPFDAEAWQRACPPGYLPASLFQQSDILSHGRIVDDTAGDRADDR